MLDTLLFYFFALLTILGAILTITRRNAVLSAVWLIVSLLGVAGLFLLQGAEFLFVTQIIVYIGGIVLLFLFVIMLVNLDAAAQVRQFNKGWPVLVAAMIGLAAEISYLFYRGRSELVETPSAPNASLVGNTEQVADLLFSRYFVAFEVASVVLLVAIIGSVWMGQRRASKETEVAQN